MTETLEQAAIAWAAQAHAAGHPPVWTRPTGARGCGRDPAAGPGTCVAWWGGCEKPEKRGCFLHWAASDEVVDWWRDHAPDDWTPHPPDLSNATASRLRSRGEIEIRDALEGEDRWCWRRLRRAEPGEGAA